MSPEAILPIAVAIMFGVPAALMRRTAWPLLANFTFLSGRYYIFGLGYSPNAFMAIDALTFGAIVCLIGTGTKIELRDLFILALFIPAAVTYGFVSDPATAYWTLWLVGMLQFILAAPFEEIGKLAIRRVEAWEG